MITTSSEQTLPLEQLTPGVTYMLVITNSPGANSLEFKHLENEVASVHPAHSAVSATTVVTQFLCPAPIMALKWAAPPVAPYQVTVMPLTFPEF